MREALRRVDTGGLEALPVGRSQQAVSPHNAPLPSPPLLTFRCFSMATSLWLFCCTRFLISYTGCSCSEAVTFAPWGTLLSNEALQIGRLNTTL